MITLQENFPSFTEHRIEFPARDAMVLTNASVAVRGEQIFAAVCCGDHFMDERGVYVPAPPDTPEDPDRFSEQTVYLAELDHDLNVKQADELLVSETPVLDGDTYRGFRGFDSARLFVWHGELWSAMCAMGTGARPAAAFFLARIDETAPGFVGIRRIVPEPPQHAEKNWMPEVVGDTLRMHYRLGTIADEHGRLTRVGPHVLAHLNGGSQVIPYRGGGLCIAHGFWQLPDTFRREYHHFFVRLDHAGRPLALSVPFTILPNAQPEIVTGMAYHPDGRLMLSYGRGDADPAMPVQEIPFVATVAADELRRILP